MGDLARRAAKPPGVSRRKVLSVTAGGACHHSNNSWIVRSSTLGALLNHRQ
jgi:hypothetical protein